MDSVLLITGPLLVPLAIWGVRHKGQVKLRKKLMNEAIQEFNSQRPDLLMRWNRQPDSKLTIERREQPVVSPPLPSSQDVPEAEFVADLIVTAEPV